MNNLNKQIIFIFLIGCIFLYHQCGNEKENDIKGKTRIAIVNPYPSYLKSFNKLIEHKIIDIPNLELKVIVYSKAYLDYDSLINIIKKENCTYISIQKIECDLDGNNLFKGNPCSDIFFKIFKKTDGILFLGGDDISPFVYNQKTRISTETKDLYRHYFELSFLFHLIGGKQDDKYKPFLEERRDYVVYGFCLGMQTMNVAAGGTMDQDIPQDIYGFEYIEDVLKLDKNKQHKNYWRVLYPLNEISFANFHRIKFTDERFLINELDMQPGILPNVKSSHHQALKTLGTGFITIATSLDGKIIEAIRHKKYNNVLGVQFHPESFDLYDSLAQKYKMAPEDTLLQNSYEILKKDESLLFHNKFWLNFNRLLHRKNKI